jgi:hypothetical protein
MKKLLLAAGIAGIAYYLKKNPQKLDDLKNSARDMFDKYKGKVESV